MAVAVAAVAWVMEEEEGWRVGAVVRAAAQARLPTIDVTIAIDVIGTVVRSGVGAAAAAVRNGAELIRPQLDVMVTWPQTINVCWTLVLRNLVEAYATRPPIIALDASRHRAAVRRARAVHRGHVRWVGCTNVPTQTKIGLASGITSASPFAAHIHRKEEVLLKLGPCFPSLVQCSIVGTLWMTKTSKM